MESLSTDELTDQMLETLKAIRLQEEAIKQNPDTPSLKVSLASLNKRLNSINEEMGKRPKRRRWGVSLLISVGKEYGGFYFKRDFTTRLCLGWIAFTFIPRDDTAWVEVGLDYT